MNPRRSPGHHERRGRVAGAPQRDAWVVGKTARPDGVESRARIRDRRYQRVSLGVDVLGNSPRLPQQKTS